MTETLTRLLDWEIPLQEARQRLQLLGLNYVAFDEPLASAAAALRANTKHIGLSLGDRACLALAQQLGAVALTADRAWATLDVGIKVELIRP